SRTRSVAGRRRSRRPPGRVPGRRRANAGRGPRAVPATRYRSRAAARVRGSARHPGALGRTAAG
ncbi:hypothetical protein ACFWN1_26425, partial [Streptomyces sp. NPDC058459]|uniref:hypothetical protein n=1 Tax=Streptomyces sp. NPDC058459 TaxID=3346508 RepID=UPI0036686F2D